MTRLDVEATAAPPATTPTARAASPAIARHGHSSRAATACRSAVIASQASRCATPTPPICSRSRRRAPARAWARSYPICTTIPAQSSASTPRAKMPASPPTTAPGLARSMSSIRSGVTGMVEAAFNPLARIDPVGLDLADDAMSRPQIASVATFPFPLPSQSDRHPIRLAFLESQFAMVPLALW